MAHHHHEHDDSYYQEQLSTIAICGAFAGAAIVLYFWKRSILVTMFGQASLFHNLVVWSGVALLVLVVLRAIALWRAVGQHEHANDCDHDHKHEHACGHDHDHDHGAHEHTHAAVSCPSGHDHGAAPWRYVVLLVPIILFLLDFPNKGPKATAGEVNIGQTDAAASYGAVIGAGALPLQQLALAAALTADTYGGQVFGMDFKSLEAASQDEYSRKDWHGKTVRVVGQFAPDPRNDRLFSLVRFRIQCCAADAVQYRVPALCRESLAGLARNQWVEVTGRVQFQKDPSGPNYITVLLVPRRQNVTVTDPDPNPYIQ